MAELLELLLQLLVVLVELCVLVTQLAIELIGLIVELIWRLFKAKKATTGGQVGGGSDPSF